MGSMLLNPLNMMNPNADGGFSPLDIAGLFRWYDASDLDTITTSTNKVTRWDDKSPNADFMTGTSGLEPDSGTVSKDGLNVIDFTRTDQMDWDEFLTGAITSHTIFIVAKADQPSAWLMRTPSYGTNFLIQGHASGLMLRFNSAGVGVVNSDSNTGAYELLSTVTTPSLATAYVNGDDSNSVYTSGVHDFAVQGVGNYSSTANDADGQLAEMIIYETALSDADRQAVEAYLTTKWNL